MVEPWGKGYRFKCLCKENRTFVTGPFATSEEASKAEEEHIKKDH